MRFQTDFSSQEYRSVRGFMAVLMLASFLLALLAVWNFSQFRGERQELERVKGALKRVKQQAAQFQDKLRAGGKALTPEQVNNLSKEIGFANELIKRKTFFWSSLLSDIERVIPSNISLSRIQLNYTEDQVTLNGSAASLQHLTQFIIRLEDSSAFQDVFLETQKAVEHGWVEFSLNARYRNILPTETAKEKSLHEG